MAVPSFSDSGLTHGLIMAFVIEEDAMSWGGVRKTLDQPKPLDDSRGRDDWALVENSRLPHEFAFIRVGLHLRPVD